MKISIITVVYNNSATINDAINSVASQSYPDIEYIVIDGRSTDGTLDILAKRHKEISTLISEPDKGIYDAMNKGINLATGDVIGILNSDDLYADRDVLSDVMRHFTADAQLDILFGNLVYVKKDNPQKIVRKWHSVPYHDNFFERANVPPHPALFLRAVVYQQTGVFDLQYRLAADYEFMLRIFKKFKFKSKYIDRLMVRMRLGGATNKSFSNILNGNKEILAAWKNNNLTPPVLLMPLRFIKRLAQFF